MATIVPGYSFTDTEQVTAEKLRLLASGTVTGLVQGDVGTGSSLITIGTSPPPTFTGAAWFDTTQGAGEGILKIFDNGKWTAISQGFLGINTGTSISRGHLVSYDSGTTPAVVGTIPVHKTSIPTTGAVQFERPIGVAAESAANAASFIVITYGYCTVLKDAVSVTAGDTVAASLTGVGNGTSGNLGSWGPAGGSATIGRWMDTSAAAADTEVSCFIYGAVPASWLAAKNNGGTLVYNAISPVANAWTGTNTFATAPIGTIGHICQVTATQSTAVTLPVVVGLRMVNASVDLLTGAATLTGNTTGAAAPNDYNRFSGQLIVFETTAASSNQLQYFFDSSTTTGWTLTVQEVGVISGGQIA
jgi:hypothetical protein